MKKKPSLTPSMVPLEEKQTFPVVAIGASAGGLEALEQFISRVPP